MLYNGGNMFVMELETNLKLLSKIKTWLESEMDYTLSDEDLICVGRKECAESLLGQIKKWEIK